MSSSKPCKSCSGSVHDSDSKSSIEYVQKQSPFSPKIPLTPPIASSMNVSGLNIDVGNTKAQNSSTWSIPNISVPPIPPNPTNTQMDVSEGPESTPQISSKANPQSKCPCQFLLNPGWNPVPSQDPFGQSKQPTLNIPSGSQVQWVDGRQGKRPLENVTRSGLLEGNPGLTLHQSDELYASSPLVHKEKVTGCHHPYASKPRTGHASSSREEIVDDEDENMSPTQSATNNEPMRDNFTAHEQGTQFNSEFTHPQMPLAQSMLNQSEMRQKRNEAFKAHNEAKHASQKEQQKWLKAELPKSIHGMKSAVHAHCLFLLKVRDKDFLSLPAPPSTEEREIAIQVAGHLEYVPKDVFNGPSTQVQSQGFQSYCKNEPPQVRTKAIHLRLGELMPTSVQRVDVYGVLPYILSCTCQHWVSSLLLEQGS
ncbi:hypothetical protein O181_085768 [Austropuccinia psidii MF-1]|uniref:Uncharacterized protein n=1 Tax=Austropuccinia psidii MF-1 TaxID=1389203 RepID=A0A9Q3ILR9_9BASI|nr:hypothetical protein [Austropuccinia psidii MF-1]